MTKQALFVSLAIVAAAGLASGAQAAPSDSADQTTGILTSPVVQPVNQDPAVEQAIKWIRSKRAHTEHVVNTAPKGGTAHKDIDKALILGYPDSMPM